MKPKLAVICLSSLLSIGMSFPLFAQVTEPPDVFDAEEQGTLGDAPDVPDENDDPGLLDNDDDTGLPEGSDTPSESGLPDAGVVVPQGVIRLEINGESAYYAPINLDETQLDGTAIPSYMIDELENGTGIDDAAVTEDEDRESFIIYPPADSIEDLEPEDILE